MSFHNYRGQPSSRRQDTGGTWSQAKTRHGQGSYDQHGRHWSWSADNRSGMPTSIIAADFSAPWYPDQQYLRINPDDTTELFVDYVAMYRDRKGALASYHAEAVRWARRNKQTVPKMGHYGDDVVEAVGLPPRALELIAASAQEHPWVLGLSEREDPRLVQFLESTSPDLESELDDFDFGADSYEATLRGELAVLKKKERPKTFKSLEALERAAAEAAEDEDAVSEFTEMGATDGAEYDEHDEDEENDVNLVDDVEDGPESIPTDDEGAESRFASIDEQDADDDADEELDDLLSIEEQHDPEARGGQRVDPRKQEIAERQGTRRPGSTARARKKGSARSAGTNAAPAKEKASKGGRAWDPDKAKGRSLADGAKPFTD